MSIHWEWLVRVAIGLLFLVDGGGGGGGRGEGGEEQSEFPVRKCPSERSEFPVRKCPSGKTALNKTWPRSLGGAGLSSGTGCLDDKPRRQQQKASII